MLSKEQLIDAANCGINGGCMKCSMSITVTEIDECERDMCRYETADWAREVLAYRAMLERLEWSRIVDWDVNDNPISSCPICGAREYNGHEPDCELVALLKESEVEK